MHRSKGKIITIAILMILFFMGMTYELPYYVYKPGQADALDEMVEVADGYSSSGHLHLVTVSGGQATPFQYAAAKILDFHDIVPIEEARPDGMSDEEYMQYQLHLMDNSQHSSMVVAYEEAEEEVQIVYNGVYVIRVVEKMPAEGKIKPGDQITQVDQLKVKEASELVDYVADKQAGDQINLILERDGKTVQKTIQVAAFPDEPEKVGIGIQLVTNEKVEVSPGVEIKSGNIGGPSAGLMFALEMYDQLTEGDLSKGYKIAGTGEIDYEGNVHRIGGIDKKVVAADKKGIDIFFAPNEKEGPTSNYAVAKEAADDINTSMEIVPVRTFSDALHYLETLETKSE